MSSRAIRYGALLALWGTASLIPGYALAQANPATPRDPQPASGTYRDGRAARPTESRDAGTAISDSWITAKTKIALFADDRVAGRQVNVDTRNGVVILNGKVDSTDAKAAAEQVVRGIEGVRQVQNNLQVVAPEQRDRVDAKDDDITKRVQDQIARDARLRNANVDVATNAGVVRLSGDVETIALSATASELARRVPGVRAVQNEITVKREDRLGRDQDRVGPDGRRSERGLGAEQDRVRRVQEALKDKGHDPGQIDGVLGPQTQQALREFQKAENLPATGQLDGQTVVRLGLAGEAGGTRPQAR
jgi:hyperosmotically inducible periplasmic protein